MKPPLLLFAKKPEPGQVKTRFFPHCSPENAASIALAMIEDTVRKSVIAWSGPVRLLVAPDADHPALKKIAQNSDIPMYAQSSGNLGEKMQSALSESLNEAPAAAVMGCDIPGVSMQILEYACDRLAEGANVLGPSADGGFYFIGLRESSSQMMDGIEWGTDSVAQTVIRRLDASGIHFDVFLACLQDMDVWFDFEQMTEIFSKFRKFLYKSESSADAVNSISNHYQ